jgi:transcriptional regulator with XRE-family HTH domain
MTRAALARAAGIDARFVGEIEAGTANPSLGTCHRLAICLGADLPLRLYPTTGPAIRDRHQSAIAEVMLAVLHPHWKAYAEIAVRRPSRGWIDLGLHDRSASLFEAKAVALPSWDRWSQLGAEPAISRLLIIRETRVTRSIAEEHRRLIRTAYPADARDALEALTGTGAWPGPAILWAARDRGGGGPYRLVARP